MSSQTATPSLSDIRAAVLARYSGRLNSHGALKCMAESSRPHAIIDMRITVDGVSQVPGEVIERFCNPTEAQWNAEAWSPEFFALDLRDLFDAPEPKPTLAEARDRLARAIAAMREASQHNAMARNSAKYIPFRHYDESFWTDEAVQAEKELAAIRASLPRHRVPAVVTLLAA